MASACDPLSGGRSSVALAVLSDVNWSFVVQVTVACLSAAAVYSAWRAARSTERNARASVIHARKAATVQHVSDRQARYRDLRAEIGALDHEISPQQWDKLLVLIGMWEHTAAGVTSGVLDLEVLDKMTGGNILATYKDYAPFIRVRRRSNPRIYDQLEVLVDKLLALQASVFRIDRPAIKRMRQLGMPNDIAERVRALSSTQHLTYHGLLRRLIETGLETDKTLIMSCSRLPGYVIEPPADSDQPEIINLFSQVQRSTRGGYPPANRTEQEGGIANWLALGPIHDRFIMRRDGRISAYVELENLDRVKLEEADDHQAHSKRYAYWHRAFEAQDRFARDETMKLDRLMVIKRLCVDPDCQGQGFGRIMLRHAIQVIQFSYERVPALVVLSKLEPSISLYESEGATRIGSFKGHAGDDLFSYVF